MQCFLQNSWIEKASGSGDVVIVVIIISRRSARLRGRRKQMLASATLWTAAVDRTALAICDRRIGGMGRLGHAVNSTMQITVDFHSAPMAGELMVY